MLLYIHIPYCDSKCHYCAFNSYVDRFDTRSKYIQALCVQLRYELTLHKVQTSTIGSVFIGGGTPSTIDPKSYEPLFKILRPYLKHNAEITAEANPNSASEQWLEGMYRLGVNRISFGVQSFDSQKLKRLGRAHSPDQAKEAILRAHRIGFEHLSLDLIYGVQGDTPALVRHDIQVAFLLPIDHLSAYELTIEEGTPFAKTPQMRQEDETLARMIAQTICSHGFEHYEVSNFGRYRCRHNLGYWNLTPYLGIGAGAVGFVRRPTPQRRYGNRDLSRYLQDPTEVSIETLSKEDLLTETVLLGLRSIHGITASTLTPTQRQRADELVEAQKLYSDTDRYYNPDFFLADALALYILG